MRIRFAALLLALALPGTAAAVCPGPVAVQVLGSGGPIADDGRASSAYLVWIEGRARLLVDAGSGTARQFGLAGASMDDLHAIALTHLHTDHSNDLPAYLKTASFSDRERALALIGPDGNDGFPGLREFTQSLLGDTDGAYRYLSAYLEDDGGRLFPLERIEVDHGLREPRTVWHDDRLRVNAVGVTHGPVPALGYLVSVGDRSIAFSGDQNSDNPAFAAMIEGADLLVMHHAIPENAGRVARNLHATPSAIGELARDADVGKLVLSHLMRRSLDHLAASRATIAEHYDGATLVAEDGLCLQP